MKKPRNRRERIEFLTKKLGSYFTQGMVAFTDKEVKKFTDGVYENLKDKEDYVASEIESICIRCNKPVLYHYECDCGFDRAVFSKED